MDTQLLEAFIAVAETGSFSLAGERVYLSQPAVSKRIAQLEEQLDCRLFDRIARTVTLTETGRQLLPRAERILREIEETRQAIADLSGAVSGSLRLAISHHIGLHRIPPLLKAYTTTYPSVEVDINFMDSEQAYEEILHGRYELAAITLAPEPNPRVNTIEVWPDPLAFMVAPDHSLVGKPSASLGELSRYPAILPGLGTYTGRIIRQLFERHRLQLASTMDTNYLETIKMMVSIGLGWSVLPRSMLSDEVREVSVPGVGMQRMLGCIHHRDRTLSNAARAFLSLLEGPASSVKGPASSVKNPAQ